MVAVVEQLGGALGESGLLVLPCVAAHINQVESFAYVIYSYASSQLYLFSAVDRHGRRADHHRLLSREQVAAAGPAQGSIAAVASSVPVCIHFSGANSSSFRNNRGGE